MSEVSSIKALQKQRQLLNIEYLAEKELFRQQTEAMGIGRKIKRGDVWYPLRVGKSFYNSRPLQNSSYNLSSLNIFCTFIV